MFNSSLAINLNLERRGLVSMGTEYDWLIVPFPELNLQWLGLESSCSKCSNTRRIRDLMNVSPFLISASSLIFNKFKYSSGKAKDEW